jgi:hypothetical protein
MLLLLTGLLGIASLPVQLFDGALEPVELADIRRPLHLLTVMDRIMRQ